MRLYGEILNYDEMAGNSQSLRAPSVQVQQYCCPLAVCIVTSLDQKIKTHCTLATKRVVSGTVTTGLSGARAFLHC